MPPASYRDEEDMRPRETYRGSDVRYAGAAHDQRRVSIDRSIRWRLHRAKVDVMDRVEGLRTSGSRQA